LDNERTASVIELCCTTLEARLKKSQHTEIRAVESHAGHLRDLRNDGLHPRSQPDEQEEPAYTEVGADQLLETSRRYLYRLDALRETATANP
jgi:hypothetical protein